MWRASLFETLALGSLAIVLAVVIIFEVREELRWRRITKHGEQRMSDKLAVPHTIHASMLGSTYILGPDLERDIDWFYLIEPNHLWDAFDWLRKEGFEPDLAADVADNGYGPFRSLRKGSYNAIITDNPEHYWATVAAARMLRYLHLNPKVGKMFAPEARAFRVTLSRAARGYEGEV